MDMFGVEKEKGGRWYVVNTSYPGIPIAGTYCKEKKDALHIAADYSGLQYKDFMRQWKKNCARS